MTDSGSNDDGNGRGRFTGQVRIYGGAAAACIALGIAQMTFSFPGESFSFFLATIFAFATLSAWVNSRK